jgi:hypothetical protein
MCYSNLVSLRVSGGRVLWAAQAEPGPLLLSEDRRRRVEIDGATLSLDPLTLPSGPVYRPSWRSLCLGREGIGLTNIQSNSLLYFT